MTRASWAERRLERRLGSKRGEDDHFQNISAVCSVKSNGRKTADRDGVVCP